jgi:sulfane dehydrogenase subunit SoxC
MLWSRQELPVATNLESNNLRVSAAADGRGMARVLADDPVDLIVLDLKLANEDGLDLMRDMLAECQPDRAARFLWSTGADYGVFDGVTCEAFVKDLPLERVSTDVLIAYEMNGAPLRPDNGHPVRLVVPGFYGTNSVKWLTRLTLAETRGTGPFTTRWYNDPVHDASGQQTGATNPVWSIAPESVIVSPAPHRTVEGGRAIEIWGWAWADGGAGTVDVSVDGGSNWMRAALEPHTGHAWQRFTVTWHPNRRGEHVLCSRARSADGRCQPLAGARNAVHRVPVRVR